MLKHVKLWLILLVDGCCRNTADLSMNTNEKFFFCFLVAALLLRYMFKASLIVNFLLLLWKTAFEKKWRICSLSLFSFLPYENLFAHFSRIFFRLMRVIHRLKHYFSCIKILNTCTHYASHTYYYRKNIKKATWFYEYHGWPHLFFWGSFPYMVIGQIMQVYKLYGQPHYLSLSEFKYNQIKIYIEKLRL